MRNRAALRSALVHRARVRLAKHARKTLPRLPKPSHTRYYGDLLAVAREAQRVITHALEPLFAALAIHQDSPEDDVRAEMRRLRIQFERGPQGAHLTAARMTHEVERANRAAMNAQFKSLVGVDVFGENPALAATLQKSITRNVGLIRSIPLELLDQVEAVVAPAVAAGTRVEVLRDRLAERFDVSESRAQFIARDQVGKLNGALVQERQQSIGVETYTWSTSKDERVRGRPGGPKSTGDHYHLEGTQQSWDDPPIVDSDDERRAHPGEDYQCRCQALPNVNDVLDALGVSEDAPLVDEEAIVEEPIADVTPEPIAEPSPRIGAVAEEIFGRKLTDPELDSIFGMSAELPEGFELSIDRIRENEKFKELRVWGSIKKQGQLVADVQRRYEIVNGVAEAHHSLFVIEDAYQNLGIGKAVFNAQIDAYRQLGVVKRVTLDAAWAGRYVWTKAGFEWDYAAERRLKIHLREHLLGKVSPAAAEEILAAVKTPQDVAKLKLADGERIGKAFLLDYPEDLVPMSQTPGQIKDL